MKPAPTVGAKMAQHERQKPMKWPSAAEIGPDSSGPACAYPNSDGGAEIGQGRLPRL